MKKVIVLSVFTLIAQFAGAQVCSELEIQKKVYGSAMHLETLNSGGQPLTEELYSLSSEQDAYIVILSYSGVQSVWKVKVDRDRCSVSSVIKQ